MADHTRRFVAIVCFMLLSSISSIAQNPPSLKLPRVSTGDSFIIDLQFRPGEHVMNFLKVEFFESSEHMDLFKGLPDSVAFSVSEWSRDKPWHYLYSSTAASFFSTFHFDDYDRNGKPDIYLEIVFGGNGAGAAGGAVFEIGEWVEGEWEVRRTLFLESIVEILDLDRDGTWEFCQRGEWWALARSHASPEISEDHYQIVPSGG